MAETPIEKAVRISGGQTELARKLTEATGRPITQAHVWGWINRSNGVVPGEYCRHIESITGITRYALRPDIFGDAEEDQKKEPSHV
jgi:DNA-binding transcriptional regulator YdaS (Cro superfamily)